MLRCIVCTGGASRELLEENRRSVLPDSQEGLWASEKTWKWKIHRVIQSGERVPNKL